VRIFSGISGALLANPLELDIHVHHFSGVSTGGRGHYRGHLKYLVYADKLKTAKYQGFCNRLRF